MRAIEPLTLTTDGIATEISQALDGGPKIEGDIRALIDVARFLKDFGPFTGNQKANTKAARRLFKWIDEGEKLLNELPKGSALLEMLFGPRQNAPVNSPEHLEAVVRQARAHYEDFLNRLESLRRRSEWLIQAKIGEHGSAGYLQERAAIAARHLCEKAGKPLAWSSPASAYRKVASYLYEAMTGERDCEL